MDFVLGYLLVYLPKVLQYVVTLSTLVLLVFLWRRTRILGFAVIAVLLIIAHIYSPLVLPYLLKEYDPVIGMVIHDYYLMSSSAINLWAFWNIFISLKSGRKLSDA